MPARQGGNELYVKMAQELWRLAENAKGLAERHACAELAKQYDRLAEISDGKQNKSKQTH